MLHFARVPAAAVYKERGVNSGVSRSICEKQGRESERNFK
jgi:hypothetical protein